MKHTVIGFCKSLINRVKRSGVARATPTELDTSTLIREQKAEIARLTSVIDGLPGCIYWKDKDGRYLGRNKFSVEKMQEVGLEELTVVDDDVIGKTDYDFFPKETVPHLSMNYY